MRRHSLYGWSLFSVIAVYTFLISCIIGWVLNIVAVVGMAMAGDPVSTLFILRCLGIVIAPLGAVLGWFA